MPEFAAGLRGHAFGFEVVDVALHQAIDLEADLLAVGELDEEPRPRGLRAAGKIEQPGATGETILSGVRQPSCSPIS